MLTFLSVLLHAKCLDLLHIINSLSPIQTMQLGGQRSESEQIFELIAHLLRRSDDRYQGFLDTLMETNHEFVISEILKKTIADKISTTETPSSIPTAKVSNLLDITSFYPWKTIRINIFVHKLLVINRSQEGTFFYGWNINTQN